MSKSKIEKVICPQCGKESDIRIWESLNAEMNPKEKQQLLDGTLFKFSCPCGCSTVIDASLLYHNMTKQTMVYYVSEEAAEDTEKMLNDIRQHDEFGMKDYNYRIVTSQNALREKAIILENDLDDRVVELVKFFLYAYVRDQHPEAEITEVLFFTDAEKRLIQFLGSEAMTVVIPDGFYEKIHNQYADRLAEVDKKELYIDLMWASLFLKE